MVNKVENKKGLHHGEYRIVHHDEYSRVQLEFRHVLPWAIAAYWELLIDLLGSRLQHTEAIVMVSSPSSSPSLSLSSSSP